MGVIRKHYDKEFKLKAVELSIERDSVADLAEELGIRSKLLYRWRSEFLTDKEKSFPGRGNEKMSDSDKELSRLKKQLADMKMERDILKKAVGIFSKNDGKSTSL